MLATLFAAALCSAPPPPKENRLDLYNNFFVTGDYVVAGVGLRGKGAVDTQTQAIVGGSANSYAKGTITVGGVPQGQHVLAAYLYWQTIEPGTNVPAGDKGTFRGSRISGRLIGKASACWSSGGGSGTTSGGQEVRSYRADVLRFLATDPTTKTRIANGPHVVALPDSGAGGSQSSGTGNQVAYAVGASLVVVYRDPTAPLRAIVIYDGARTANQDAPEYEQEIKGFYEQSAANAQAKMTHIAGDGDSSFKERLWFNGTALTSPLLPVDTNPFQGAQGLAWDNLTVDVSSLMAGVTNGTFKTKVTPVLSSVDCLSWTSIIFSTTVQDTDRDGLLDSWELNQGYTDVLTGGTVPLPGANPNVPDIFVEVDHMVYGDLSADQSKPGHSHRPKNEALKMMADAFGLRGIKLHFDIGAIYSIPAPAALPSYIVPAAFANGGQPIDEDSVTCVPSATKTCAFPNEKGVIGWRRGFRALKLAYFQKSRRHAYHYTIFGHALGRPEPADPAKPRKISGIADKPGSNIAITLGLWRSDDTPGCQKDPAIALAANQKYCVDRVGNTLTQAGTFMHELGHNLNLGHGGDVSLNCKPNYVSVMNYLFQVRGVPKGDGTLSINYSAGALSALNENTLRETDILGAADLRTRWYAPPGPLDLTIDLAQAGSRFAKRYCDGTPIPATAQKLLRVDGKTPVSVPTDWNNSGTIESAEFGQDANLNGPLDILYSDSNDWSRLDARQVGGSPNLTRVSLGVARDDLGLEDVGLEDVGLEDVGLEDVGLEDVGLEDVGLEDVGEIDYETAASTADAPGALSAIVTKDYIEISWPAPEFGQTRRYGLWRKIDSRTATDFSLITSIDGAPPATLYRDYNVKNNTTYIYFVTAYSCDPNVTGNCSLIQSAPSTPLSVLKR
ncbi:MAG: hypothetical protein HYX27_14115 [Acidobacteria bacterium]|nr:hypothetical protein [Acidobacteriota bacterium]